MGGMKRFLRWTLNGLTVLSLVLVLLVAASWVFSHRRADEFSVADGVHRTFCSVIINRGSLQFLMLHGEAISNSGSYAPGFHHRSSAAYDMPNLDTSFLGFLWTGLVDQAPGISRSTVFISPHAYLVALFAALPAVHFLQLLRRRRVKPAGHCLKCGYDLRATPDRCPECGTAVTPTAATAE